MGEPSRSGAPGRDAATLDAEPALPATTSPRTPSCARCYRALLLPRLIEEKMLRLLRQGRLSKWFSGIGQEAIAVGVAVGAASPTTGSCRCTATSACSPTRGVDLAALFRQLLGKEGGFTQGPRPHLPLRHARDIASSG